MAVVACLDKIETMEANEREGRLVRVRRRAFVRGLTDTDYRILFSALEDIGIPPARDPLEGAPDLFLLERNPIMTGENQIEIDLIYEAFHISNDILLSNPPFGVLEGGQQTSIQQVETNVDENGNVIELSHTYPDDDPDFAGKTITQGGVITNFQAQKTFSLKFVRNTSTPWVFSDQMIQRVNTNVWRGEPKRTWMATSVNWFLHRVDGGVQYRFDIEFQHNPDTWDPSVRFIDSRTGKPPVNLVEGVGFKTVEKNKAIDFDQLLGSPVTGIST